MKTEERAWQVYAPEGPFHGKTGHPFSYSICAESESETDHGHDCIALAFGETDEQALERAEKIVKTAGLRAQLEALTVLLRAKCSDREWAEMCKKFDELAKTAELRALVGELADALDHEDYCKFPKSCTCGVSALLARAEEATK